MFDRQGQFLNNYLDRGVAQSRPLIFCFVLVIGLLLGGCQSLSASQPAALVRPAAKIAVDNLKEVAPPRTIQALGINFNQYQPQVEILSPAPDAVLKKTTVAVKLDVKNFPISDDADIPLRPHLHLILDNEPYRAIYNTNEAIALEDLEPGTHTLRVFPVRPWHESYKNDGAYAQTTFHVLTKTDSNNPDPNLPLLTYSRPKGDYGAEPILLDYYLTNAPLHIAAETDEAIADWRIRVTINDQSFLLDQWQPIYLKGFQTGENWIKLEFIDDQGNLIANRFNNTVRVINYQPGGQDALSRLVRGDETLAEAYRLTGSTIPEFLPDVEELMEETETLILPATDNFPATVEEQPESKADSYSELRGRDFIETLPRPGALPPKPVESPVDLLEEMTDTDLAETNGHGIPPIPQPDEWDSSPDPVNQAVPTDNQNPQNADQNTPSLNAPADSPKLTEAEAAAHPVVDLSEIAPLEERIEVLEEIIKTEIPAAAAQVQ